MKKNAMLFCVMLALLLTAGTVLPALAAVSWDCSYCGHRGNRGEFCEECGQNPSEGAVCCLECGNPVREDSLYCDFCGICVGHWRCAVCGKENPRECEFCPEDGTPRHEPGTWTCPVCGSISTNGVRFCPMDGSPRPDASAAENGGEEAPEICLECGASVPQGSAVCERCGTPLGHWMCSVCGREYTRQDLFCAMDGTGRHLPSMPLTAVRTGDRVCFGHYEQDGDTSNGKEPIEWLVLEVDGERGRALLLSVYALDARAYDDGSGDVTWETCGLRKWLNGEFQDTAFTPKERDALLLSKVDNGPEQGYSRYGTDGGNPTEDRVFLLSYAEANRYLGVMYRQEKGGMNARASATAYAVSRGVTAWESRGTGDGERNCRWWLRSPGYFGTYAGEVYTDGSLYSSLASSPHEAVRPALWVTVGREAD